MVDDAQPKRLGRPPKHVQRPKNASFTFRLLADLRQRLEADAAAHSISLSEEIERRLYASYRAETMEETFRRVIREERPLTNSQESDA